MEKQRKPRVLLTGFTPFGGERINPALEAVKRVRCPEAELRILEVPTVFGDSARLVTAEMDAFRPDVVLCVGQAAGRSAVTPERVAINVDDARIPDNNGCQPVDAPIVPGGPAAYFATVPVKDMVRAIREAGVPSELSNSAGTYVQPPAVSGAPPRRPRRPGGVHPCALHPGADGGHRSPLPAPGAAGDGPGGGGFGLL